MKLLVNKHIRHSRLLISLSAILLCVIAVSCSSRKTDEHTLVVSLEPQRAILEAIVGDRFTVTTLLPSGANPETFEPTIKTRKAVDNASAYFYIGNIPFEDKIIETLPPTVTTVNTSTGIVPVYGTHNHEHHHDAVGDEHHHNDIDPHTWTSVRNAHIIATNMFEALKKLDPDGSDYYTKRYLGYIAHLDSLDNAFASRLSTQPDKAFAIWHPSLSYFARDYGLEQIAVGFENKEVSPLRLAEVAKHAKAEGVTVLFFQKEYDSRQVQSLNSALNAKIVIINPLAYDWEQQLENVTHALERK